MMEDRKAWWLLKRFEKRRVRMFEIQFMKYAEQVDHHVR